MAHSGSVVDVLKRELKARGVTYAQVARKLNLSEASVKRMFSRRSFTLRRLDQVCELADTEFSDLARALQQEEKLISQLTHEQEREIVSNRKLFLLAVCALNHVGLEQILATYDLTRAECIQLLVRLDRLGFIQLLPDNRIRLMVSHNFAWLTDGPIQRFFREQAHNEYFQSRFDRPDEYIIVLNSMLSSASGATIVAKLKRLARECSELHREDARLPLGERSAMSVLLAVRHWELRGFADLRRRKPNTRRS